MIQQGEYKHGLRHEYPVKALGPNHKQDKRKVERRQQNHLKRILLMQCCVDHSFEELSSEEPYCQENQSGEDAIVAVYEVTKLFFDKVVADEVETNGEGKD